MAERGGLITLAQALDAFPAVRFNLDVKAAAAATPVGRIVAPHADRVLITSFSDDRRREALDRGEPGGSRHPSRDLRGHGDDRAAARWRSTARSDRLVRRALRRRRRRCRCPSDGGALRIVTPRLIAAAHRHDVEVHVWTVNDPADMRRLVDMGVDGIVTDRADVALQTLRG